MTEESPDQPFIVQRFDEPKIEFSEGKAKSVRSGLIKYGPRLKGGSHHTINLGIIGDRSTIQKLLSFVKEMKIGIHPGEKMSPDRVPYPGTGKDSPLDLSINMDKLWRRKISRSDLRALSTFGTEKEKMEYILDLFEEDLKILEGMDPRPDVVIVCLPKELMNEFSDMVRHENSNLHNRIKILGMKYDLPTQLIKPSNLNPRTDKKKASMAWNLTVGLLYKSQKGYPWKTKELESETCYAGLSFYKEKGTDNVRVALAHIFIDREHFILRSDPIERFDEDPSGTPHLTEDSAEEVVGQILEHYKAQKGTLPSRLVLHKSSAFWDEEINGFLSKASKISELDFATIRRFGTDIRLFPDGSYPPLRGTLLSSPSDELHYLYTYGYEPEDAVYRGVNIPRPIEVDLSSGIHDSTYQKICKEILFFTKLDWNTSDFAVKEPVTTGVSRKVGKVLSEVDQTSSRIKPQYFYYM